MVRVSRSPAYGQEELRTSHCPAAPAAATGFEERRGCPPQPRRSSRLPEGPSPRHGRVHRGRVAGNQGPGIKRAARFLRAAPTLPPGPAERCCCHSLADAARAEGQCVNAGLHQRTRRSPRHCDRLAGAWPRFSGDPPRGDGAARRPCTAGRRRRGSAGLRSHAPSRASPPGSDCTGRTCPRA